MDFTYAKLKVVKSSELTTKLMSVSPATVSNSSYTMTNKRWSELQKQLEKVNLHSNDVSPKVKPKNLMERTQLSSVKTRKWVDAERATKESSLLKECTFKPNINHSFIVGNEYPRSCHFEEMQHYIEDRREKEWSACMGGVNGKNKSKYKEKKIF